MKTPFWNAEVQEGPAKTKALAELAKIEAVAARQRAEADEKLAIAQRQEEEWHALLAAGKAAWARLSQARDHLQILHDRHALAGVRFDRMVGGFDYSTEWHRDLLKLDPLADGAAYGPLVNHENPFVFHARTIAALEIGIARIEKRLPEFERAEADARRAAKTYAKAHGRECDIDLGRETDTAA